LSNADTDDEWTVDRLDLDAYVARVGVTGALHVDSATLTSLHRAHLAAIPFENLDVILGRGVSVDLDRVQAKLVHDRRGGYCYEHGVLFSAVLVRLGFTVRRLLARVGGDLARPHARTHMTLFVDVDGQRWLADVGFGSGLLEPIPLEPEIPRRQGDWSYRLTRPTAGLWQLEELQDGTWVGQYTVEEQPQHQSDVVMANHFTSTWPGSPFVQRPVVVRKDEQQVRRLLGRELSFTRPGSAPATQTLEEAEIGPALRDLGLDLRPADVDALVVRSGS
jgi:N-hydroxyarylamine O-acetyltransferase